MSKSPDKRLLPGLGAMRSLIRAMRMIKLRLFSLGRLTYARNAYIGPGAKLYIPGRASIGTNVSIGGDFLSQVNFQIGDECLVSSRVSFVGNDHDVVNSSSAYFSGRTPPSRVVLEGNNFIGFGATLIGNITIGHGAVVAARAVVIRDVMPGEVVAGVPARVIKRRIAATSLDSIQ